MAIADCQQPQRPLPIIHLNAFPGTGKLTIARILTSHFRPGSAKLVHNHLLINPVDAVLHREQEGYQTLRRELRSAVFSALISEPATYPTAYIFTDFQTTNELGVSVCKEYVDCAAKRGCDFIPVTLVCDEETNLKRLVGSQRVDTGKLVDAKLVKQFRDNAAIYDFDNHSALLRLDVTQLSAEEAAARILRHLVDTCPELGSYVADSSLE